MSITTKKSMTNNKEKILHRSKPTIWYYLLAVFFPIMFFLVDDSRQLIFDHWEKSIKTFILNLLALFMFFGIPILMLTFRREITIYNDRIVIYKPTIKTLKTYHFKDLEKWNIKEIYTQKLGRQVNLTLKFRNKRLTFNKIELTGFSALTKILETNYSNKNYD
mgnify:CR=1 FL=1